MVKPLKLELIYHRNDKYFPGRYGARIQIEMNLKKFIPIENILKDKTDKKTKN